MKWKKLGVLIKPDPALYWMASHAGPSFVDIVENRALVYLTGRDTNNVSRIGIVEISLEGEKHRVISISPKPVFDVGEMGSFDESGVSYPWLVKKDNRIYMYYVGWVAGGLTRFQNSTGLAISHDGGKTFQRASRAPILERTDAEPVSTGSCSVLFEKGRWKMYYTSFDKWEAHPESPRPFYNIKLALSEDGIHWIRKGEIIVNYKNAQEHIIGKPVILKDGELYRLWYSCRGSRYRIGYAESRDGIHFVRKDEEVGIDVSPSGWDSEMIEYAFVFDHKGNRYLIYNGNDFGKTGLGLAILV